MNIEDFTNIMDSDIPYEPVMYEGCKALKGLNLIAKYLPKSGIEAAVYEKIYACVVDDLIEAGITEEDTIQLRKWNWMIDEGCLAKFV